MALPTHRTAAAALAVLLLVPFFGVRTTPVSAQSGSSQHTLTLDPALVHWAAAGFSNSTFDDNECVPDFPDSQIQVGYTHSTDVSSIASDTFVNCVYQTAVRFDLSPVHQYPGAVITSATVHYDEQIIKLRDPNGYEPANGTPDVFPDAVVGTCVGRIGIPTEEWDGTRGLIPNDSDATVQRVAGPVWDVTDQANHWYLYPDDPNLGLMFAGYDEGGEFSNQAECVSVLSHVQLIVELVANDPTSTPTPTFLQRVGDASRASSGALPSPTSTPLVIDVGKLHPIVVQPTPTAVERWGGLEGRAGPRGDGGRDAQLRARAGLLGPEVHRACAEYRRRTLGRRLGGVAHGRRAAEMDDHRWSARGGRRGDHQSCLPRRTRPGPAYDRGDRQSGSEDLRIRLQQQHLHAEQRGLRVRLLP